MGGKKLACFQLALGRSLMQRNVNLGSKGNEFLWGYMIDNIDGVL